ncbi:MAG: hypothetical protein IT510_08080 [Sulfuritalea sp.]|jgi:hypothetical protein|nr:hypothetical protein [Sulfuritalea sp.]
MTNAHATILHNHATVIPHIAGQKASQDVEGFGNARPARAAAGADAHREAQSGWDERETETQASKLAEEFDADRRADLVRSLVSAPEAFCIQLSRLDRCEGGVYRTLPR